MRRLLFQLLVVAALLLCNEVFAGGRLYVYVMGPTGKYFDGFQVRIYEWERRYCSFEAEGENRNGEGIPYAIIEKLEYFSSYHIHVCKRIQNGFLQKSFDIHFQGPSDTVTLKIDQFDFSPLCGPNDVPWMEKGMEMETRPRGYESIVPLS
jgi:hypothetical protein